MSEFPKIPEWFDELSETEHVLAVANLYALKAIYEKLDEIRVAVTDVEIEVVKGRVPG